MEHTNEYIVCMHASVKEFFSKYELKSEREKLKTKNLARKYKIQPEKPMNFIL